jgi:hypothetical protein
MYNGMDGGSSQEVGGTFLYHAGTMSTLFPGAFWTLSFHLEL